MLTSINFTDFPALFHALHMIDLEVGTFIRFFNIFYIHFLCRLLREICRVFDPTFKILTVIHFVCFSINSTYLYSSQSFFYESFKKPNDQTNINKLLKARSTRKMKTGDVMHTLPSPFSTNFFAPIFTVPPTPSTPPPK